MVVDPADRSDPNDTKKKEVKMEKANTNNLVEYIEGEIDNLKELLEKGKKIEHLEARFNELKYRAEQIEVEGYYSGGIWWKDGNYLYKQYHDGEKRIREYVGNDPKKIAEVMDQIKRWEELRLIEVELNVIKRKIDDAVDYLYRFVVVIER